MPSNPRVRVRDGQRGTALIEFALILPFMLVFTLTAVDLSRAFYLKSALTSAAREGARTAIGLQTPASGGSADNQLVVTKAKQVLFNATKVAGVGLSNITVTVTAPTSDYYKVTVSGQFNWLYLGALKWMGPSGFTTTQTLTAAATMESML